MKSFDEIKSEVIGIITNALKNNQITITEESNIADLSADSIQLFELLLAFEKHYELNAAYDDVVRLHTVKDIIDYVARVKYAIA